MAKPLTFCSQPVLQGLSGRMAVPGDKSISHRALMLGAIADGETTVQGLLMGADNLATRDVFRALGVTIEHDGDRTVIAGVGLHGLSASQQPVHLDVGNSGTAMRLLCGLLAGQAFDSVLTGDDSLLARPMRRIAAPLREMGAQIVLHDEQYAPITITANDAVNQALVGQRYTLATPSAQVKSGILLAGLYANGKTEVVESAITRDHTERMLAAFGYSLERGDMSVSLIGGGRLTAAEVMVPGDISSAAFFLVAASIVPGSDIVLTGVGVNPTRVGVITILQAMGADITLVNSRCYGEEPVADIRVRYAPLQGIEIPESQVPLAIDEFPVLMVAAACAEGETRLQGARELRVKESDRIATVAAGLQALGVSVEILPDGMVVQGSAGEQSIFSGGEVDSLGDHRIAMAFAIAGARAAASVMIKNCNNVATSFPDFVTLAAAAGLSVSES